MATKFDRYAILNNGNRTDIVPFGEVPQKSTDVYETYKKGQTRLDQLSYQYYGSCDYDWLIMQANPQYGSMEFSIPDGSILRIPFPLTNSIDDYISSVEKHKKYYK